MDEPLGSIQLSDDLKGFSAKILEWKQEYRNIYYQKVGTNEYIYRLLTKNEYLSLYFMQFHISSSAEDILLDKCVLYPEYHEHDWNELKAGEPATLVENILISSGFSNLDNIKKDLDKEREKIRLLDNQIVVVICKAFPHITPSEIDTFDYPTIIHYVALAEAILGTELEIKKLEDPKKPIDFNKDNREHGFGPKAIFPQKPMKRR